MDITEVIIAQSKLQLLKGDITRQDTEAIVNAANKRLASGGGVAGAIHRTAGGALWEECKKLNGCETGEAKLTKAYGLPNKFVIHTVGPVWSGGNNNEDALLRNAYRNSLTLAKKHNIQSISFPSISTGVYHFPIERAARLAISTFQGFLKEHPFQEVRFVLFSEKDFLVYKAAWEEIKNAD